MIPSQVKKLKQCVAGMVAAASAYEQYAPGWKESIHRDPFKSTRLKDFKAAAQAGLELLEELAGEEVED